MPPDEPVSSVLASLPLELTSFVGRKRELAELMRLLGSARLITLTGAAGSGKTRLALRVALESSSRFTDGVAWVELASLDEPQLVVQAVAQAFGIIESPDRPLLDTVCAMLRARRVLIVLDNCEHVRSACAALAQSLLALPGVRLLATSREPLHVAGEMRYPVPPLAMPAAHAPFSALDQIDAIRLFLDRARAIIPAFNLTPDNGPLIAAICQRLDGMPLAIELVSALVDVMTVNEITARLEDRPALFETISPASRNPHRTMRAALDWSFELLSAAEQTMLRRLSVFSGGWSLSAAEAVCAGSGIAPAQAPGLLTALVHKSLVAADTLRERATRYRLLEIVRQYAQEKLDASGESEATHDRLLNAVLEVSEAAAPHLVGPHQQQRLAELEAESGNLRVALDWALAANRIEDGVRLAVALYQFWDRRGHWREGFGWFERLNDRLGETEPVTLRIQALSYGSFLAMSLNHQAAALRWSESALALCDRPGAAGTPFLSLALSARAGAARTTGDAETAYSLSGRILDLDRAAPDPLLFGMQVYIHGFLAIVLGHYDVARADLHDALSRARQHDDSFRIALALTALGDLGRCEGRHAQSLRLYDESLAHFRHLAASHEIPVTERAQAFAALRSGDTPRAYALFLLSLDAMVHLEDHLAILHGLLGCAALAASLDQPILCARLHGFVAGQLDGQSPFVDATAAADRLDVNVCVQHARIALGDATFANEEADGRTLSLAQALDLAHGLPTPADDIPAHEDGLTRREREVAALVGSGLSNGEIAAALVLSKRTVEKHIANLLSKLAFTHRAQVVRWAIEQGLTEPRR